jgi:galactokinase
MEDIAALHRAEYGAAPRVVAKAPGGVNIVGSYTEPNQGYVLSTSINRWMTVAVSPRTDNAVRILAVHLGERKRANVTTLKYRREDRWANLPKGVLWELANRGVKVSGMNVTLHSSIPDIEGLGLHVATLSACSEAFASLYGCSFTSREVFYVARNVLDRFLEDTESMAALVTVLHARDGQLLHIDTRSLRYNTVENALNSAIFVVTDSGVPPAVSNSERKQRLDDCRTGTQAFAFGRAPRQLREMDATEVREAEEEVPEHVRRRCLHVIEENERVLKAVDAIQHGDAVRMGRILVHSHDSQRDLYEISCPEVDWLVKRSCEVIGMFGATLTGPGFGGCTVALLEETARSPYYARLEEYERIFGFHPEVMEVGTGQCTGLATEV